MFSGIKLLPVSLLFCGMAFAQTPFPLDLSGNTPPFLKPNEIREDLQNLQGVLERNYVRTPILAQKGVNWAQVLGSLERRLGANPNPILTHHFQEQLAQALTVTQDSQIQTDLMVQKRHYHFQVEPLVPFTSRLPLVLEEGRHRVLPNNPAPQAANKWLIGCEGSRHELFPTPPERANEERFVLGVRAQQNPPALKCAFEDELGRSQTIELPLLLPPAPRNGNAVPIFEHRGGKVNYVRWYRDGSLEERETFLFQRLARELRPSRTLVLDVRGNHSGSFGFIERWLREMTQDDWQNVILREWQSRETLEGLVHRLEWLERNTGQSTRLVRQAWQQKKQQLQALIDRNTENEIPAKWVETKFLFSGNNEAPAWNKRLIVVANRHCGDGCQFLVALTRQVNGAVLLGAETGPFPQASILPMYQLPRSKVMITLSHFLHLDHLQTPVAPTGYAPDFWLFDDHPEPEILRFAASLP